MVQQRINEYYGANFPLRARMGLISRYAENLFNDALREYKQKSGELPILQGVETEIPLEERATTVAPAVSAQALPGLLKFSTNSLTPLLAIEAAIHNHLDKCRSLPAVLYVDSRFFMPAFKQQYKRIKYKEFNGSYYYFAGHNLVSIAIATEQSLDNSARAALLGGVIPSNVIISSMSL